MGSPKWQSHEIGKYGVQKVKKKSAFPELLRLLIGIDSIEKIGGFAQKNDFGPKTALLGPKGPLWAIGAEKRPAERPNSNLPENRRYPELPQDMGNL